MSQPNARQLKIVAAWSVIFLLGAFAGWAGARTHRKAMLAQLTEDAQRSAVAFDATEIRQLSGSRADLGTPVYGAVKNRLRALQAVNPRVRFVYLFRPGPTDGGVIYLADSAAPGAKDESLPGDVYPQAATSPGLQQILRTGQPATEGPLDDDFGSWVTGYARVGGSAMDASGRASEILGVDIDAGNWGRELWLAGFQHAFYVWILLGLPLGAWFVTLRQFEQREVIRNFSEAMEQSHSAILIVDLGSRIEYANRGLCQQIGYSRRELIGRPWRDFQVADTTEARLSELIATVRSGQPWEGEWFNRRKDGSVYPVRGVVTPVKHRNGTLSCFVAVFDDVTEVKKREAELLDARDHAEAGDRAKSQFLATMSHEVRTPLNGIVGFTSLLLDTELDPDQREYVQTIRTSGEALIQLTGGILDFARIESGKIKLDPIACDPRDCIEEALDLLAGKAAEKGVALLHHVAPDVPAAVIIDGGRLRQILVNLVGNAVKFTERGEIEVSLRLAPSPSGTAEMPAAGSSAASSCTLLFSVRDTGIGIAAQERAKLFKPFSQLDESSTRRYGGTGLGLAISRNLARMLGGDVDFVSTLGEGSTFHVTVSAAVAAPAPDVPRLGELRLGLAISPGPLRTELARLAETWGATVVETDTAEALAQKSPEIALIDVSEELARALAAQTPPLAGLPPEKTFGLVPLSFSSELRQPLRTHFRLLINKPVHHAALFNLLVTASPHVSPQTVAPPRFGLRVLLVEDNPVNQRLMQRVLETLGCTWTLVTNGRFALQELAQRASNYDLALLDLHMPEMDGITALHEIRHGRAGPRAQTMWIIALTADVREEQRARTHAAGVNDFLTKPLKRSELEAAFRRFRAARTTLAP